MIRVALPAGDLRAPAAGMLAAAGLTVEGYGEGSRSYRLAVREREDVQTRVFRERDIPIQVALGNYDLGICSLAWVTEMGIRFPEQPVVPLCNLGFGSSGIFAAVSASDFVGVSALSRLPSVRIASEYPNIAEAFALAARFPVYRVQAVWGSAEGYPPEDADLVVVATEGPEQLSAQQLSPVHRLLESSAWLVANRESLQTAELGSVLAPLISAGSRTSLSRLSMPDAVAALSDRAADAPPRTKLRLAVPDGHQQRHVVEALADAGLRFDGYDDGACVRRPGTSIDALEVKVVRPHDMPQLIALGQIDLAITGRDCLMEHLYQFPSSPASEVLDLERGQYNLSAVVSEDLPADNIEDAIAYWRHGGKPFIRLASEFMSTADHYARSRHLWRYRVIPIAGASEGFVPEDAELLIEGTETGRTLRENRLKPIDLLYRSTTCVIGHANAQLSGRRRELHAELLGALGNAARAA